MQTVESRRGLVIYSLKLTDAPLDAVQETIHAADKFRRGGGDFVATGTVEGRRDWTHPRSGFRADSAFPIGPVWRTVSRRLAGGRPAKAPVLDMGYQPKLTGGANALETIHAAGQAVAGRRRWQLHGSDG